mmetsp:Transcript_24359/g.39771  ORF Transcript_24359/g.39771 Transcript_24359/m.39771 type:complete len:419 (-) Transcript_24359:98-1354(-)
MLPGPGPVALSSPPLQPQAKPQPSRPRAPSSRLDDVESASRLDEEELGTPPPTPTPSSAEPSPTDVESASLTDVETQSTATEDRICDPAAAASADLVLKKRWQCDLCFESHGHWETPWRLGEEGCIHSLCQGCIRGSIQWGGRCPYDDTPIPQIVVCGVMGTGEYLYHEKQKEARRVRGIMCSATECPGVAPAIDSRPPRPTACSHCKARHCGRVVCGAPWTEGHRCWDIVDEERRRAERQVAIQTLDAPFIMKRRLALGPRFRPCPQCGVMVEHIGGCNMVYHESCRTRWCFVCRRVGTCSDFDCRSPGSTPPTPRGLAEQPLPSSARKLSKAAMMRVALLMVFIALFMWVGLQVGVPRNGFLKTISGVASTCESGSCTSDLESATAQLAAAVQEPLKPLLEPLKPLKEMDELKPEA